jgi:DNA-damage-inducible protein J
MFSIIKNHLNSLLKLRSFNAPWPGKGLIPGRMQWIHTPYRLFLNLTKGNIVATLSLRRKAMIKTDTIRARIDPKLKENVKKILQKIGMTPSQYINIAFKRLEQERDIPFDLHIPNEETKESLKEAENLDNLDTFNSIDDLYKDVGIKPHAKN